MEQGKKRRTLGITIVAVLMILFGLAEVVTSFTHNFFGITTTSHTLFTYPATALGVCYAAAGGLSLTMKKWAAGLTIGLLMADVVGRVALVVTGFFPTDSFLNTFSIIVGTAIATIFTIYIGWKWKSFG
jgi:hypothetical protein